MLDKRAERGHGGGDCLSKGQGKRGENTQTQGIWRPKPQPFPASMHLFSKLLPLPIRRLSQPQIEHATTAWQPHFASEAVSLCSMGSSVLAADALMAERAAGEQQSFQFEAEGVGVLMGGGGSPKKRSIFPNPCTRPGFWPPNPFAFSSQSYVKVCV